MLAYREQFILAMLFTGFTTLILGFFVYLRNPKSRLYRIFSLYSFSISWWSLFQIGTVYGPTSERSWLCSRLEHIGVALIPTFFLHFVTIFLEIKDKKWLLRFSYLLSTIFIVAIPMRLLVSHISRKLGGLINYGNPGPLYAPLLIFFVTTVCYCLWELFKAYRDSSALRRNQLKYLLWSSLFGYIGGFANFSLIYDINIPILNPFGTYFVGLYALVVAYAMRKYNLLDINIALARAGILIFVYAFVLGIPFGLAGWGKEWLISYIGQSWFWAPMFFLLAFATTGPVIYNSLRKKAEDAILKEQKQYQKALLEISSSLMLIKELDRLLETSVVKILDIVNVSWAAVYLKDEKGERYILKYQGNGRVEPDLPGDFISDSDFIKRVAQSRRPVIGEEINGLGIKCGLVMPCVVNDGMLGFLLLGDKPAERAYTQDDVNVFTVLANQIALALENAGFIDEFQKTQAQLFATEQMASMGTMAGGMTHQINNRFHAIILATSDTLDTLKFIDLEKMPEEAKNYLADVKYALTRVQENAKHGGKIANDFLNFSQPERMQREAKEFDLREPIARAIEMVRLKTSFSEDKIEKLVPDESFQMEGNFVLLQDAFFNLLDNATDAIKKREDAMVKNTLPAVEGYKGKIIIQMSKMDSIITVQFRDDGIGLTEEQKKKMFVPFFTTKATAAKGTGLGLYVIQRIVQAHHGQIKIDSEYGQGTAFTIVLPVSQNK